MGVLKSRFPKQSMQQSLLLSLAGLLLLANSGFAENWDNICQSDFGGLCCAPGMENSRYFMAEYPASWMQHEGDCKDLGGQLVAFETRAEMDCVIQYMEDKFPVSTYPFSWAIGLASSYRYKGVYHWHPNDTTMSFDNWAVGSPSGAECVSLSLASPHFGMWVDVGCRAEDEASLLMAVCEKAA